MNKVAPLKPLLTSSVYMRMALPLSLVRMRDCVTVFLTGAQSNRRKRRPNTDRRPPEMSESRSQEPTAVPNDTNPPPRPSVGNKVIVVLGAQWGDEGKGKVVDLLAQDANIVCRCQVG